MANTLKDRLKSAITESRMSEREVSLKATGKPDTVRDIMRGKVKNPRSDTLQALARVLRTDSAQLTGEPIKRRPQAAMGPAINGLTSARVVGLAQAGAFMDIDASGRFEVDPQWIPTTADNDFPHAQLVAYEIVGDSIDKLCRDGGHAIAVAFADTGLVIQDGMIVVAERQRGELVERTIKRVRQIGNRFELHPESTNAKHKPIRFPTTTQDEEVRITALVRRFLSPTIRW